LQNLNPRIFFDKTRAGAVYDNAALNKDETLNGTKHNDTIFGLGGVDKIHGYDGNGWLYGGRGEDKIFGGPRHDRLYGGDGADTLDGGAGRDVYVLDPRHATRERDKILSFDPTQDFIVFNPASGFTKNDIQIVRSHVPGVGSGQQDFTLRVKIDGVFKPFASLVDLGNQRGLSKKSIEARIVDQSHIDENNMPINGFEAGNLFEFL